MNSIIPLMQFPIFSSQDIDEARETVANIFCPHQIKLDNITSQFSTQVNEAALGQSALVYISYGTAVTIDTDILEDCFLIQVPWAGCAEVLIKDSKTIIKPGVASVVSPKHSMNMRWSNDCSFFTLRLDRQKVEQTLINLLGHELQNPLIFDPIFDLNTYEGKSWLNAINFARHQLEQPLPPQVLLPLLQQIEHTLCLMFLKLARHNYQQKINNESKIVTPKSVRRAQDYIQDNIQQNITLEELAEITEVAQATLNKHFNDYLGQSPIKYIRNQKLAAAHQLLISSTVNYSITDIALKYGFNHLGRFSEYYKRKYGELPSYAYKNKC